jgi:hypothetical protein
MHRSGAQEGVIHVRFSAFFTVIAVITFIASWNALLWRLVIGDVAETGIKG